MPRLLDIVGQRFGSLVVVSRRHDLHRWACRCDCGAETFVGSSDLTREPKNGKGPTRQCAKCGAELNRRNLIKDLTGQRFGKLVAVERLTDRHPIKWRCVCDCGGEKAIWSTALIIGKTQSCGCIQRERTRALGLSHARNPVGMKYGKLTILSRDTHGPRMCHCVCDCGGHYSARLGNLVHGHTRSCGCLKWGVNNHAYDPTIPDEERIARHRVSGIDAYRRSVYARDDYTCAACGKRGGRLVVHHIKSWKHYKALRQSKRNGAVLCEHCHNEFHKKFGKTAPTHWEFVPWVREKRAQRSEGSDGKV
jgi:5-methylcytosine-specific restriction endonuclease McrA